MCKTGRYPSCHLPPRRPNAKNSPHTRYVRLDSISTRIDSGFEYSPVVAESPMWLRVVSFFSALFLPGCSFDWQRVDPCKWRANTTTFAEQKRMCTQSSVFFLGALAPDPKRREIWEIPIVCHGNIYAVTSYCWRINVVSGARARIGQEPPPTFFAFDGGINKTVKRSFDSFLVNYRGTNVRRLSG